MGGTEGTEGAEPTRLGSHRQGLTLFAALAAMAFVGACKAPAPGHLGQPLGSGAGGAGAGGLGGAAGSGGASSASGGSGGGKALCTKAGEIGCACKTPGAKFDCGKVIRRDGSYVTCTMGAETCQPDHTWGACIGEWIKTALDEPPPPGAQADGLGSNVMCTGDPCDPYCRDFTDTPAGLTPGGGLTVGPGGLTLLQGASGGPCSPLPPETVGNLQCYQSVCAANLNGGNGTSISGTVYDPAGVNPVYNAIVYVPNAALTPFTPGTAADTCTSVVSGAPLVSTLTGADGTFKLANVPPGASIPLVIQSGRWRRQFTITVPAANACANTPIAGNTLHFPANQSQGDIPQLAVATGAADATECLLWRMGISTSEFTAPGALNTKWATYQGGRVHLFQHNGGTVGGSPSVTNLYGSPAMLSNYQAIFSPSTGSQWTFAGNGWPSGGGAGSWDGYLVSWANAGGRIFTSHYNSYALIAQFYAGSLWPATQNWNAYGPSNEPVTWYVNYVPDYNPASIPMPYLIDTGFPQGAAFYTWLSTVGALTTNPGAPAAAPGTPANPAPAPGTYLMVSNWKHVVDSVNAPFGLEWANGNTATNGDYPTLPGNWCVYNGLYNGCNSNDYWYCGCGGWEFEVNPQLGLFTPGAGQDSLLTTFDTPLNTPPYYGRVVQTGMLVSEPSAGTFPNYCNGGALLPQEKALEFMLFETTSCATDDTITPVIPPPAYNSPASYTRDYQAVCAVGTAPVWEFFDYNTTDPLDSSIVFTAQSAATQAALGAATVASIGTANAANPNGPNAVSDVNTVDTQLKAVGSFSQTWLRVTMTLNPSSNKAQAPSLSAWQQNFDCAPSE